MKIEHLAIWTEDLDLLRRFYTKYFDAECGEMYVNNSKKFSSYFLTFGKGGTRIELMHTPDIENRPENGNLRGLAHFAISVGEKDIVDSLTKKADRRRCCSYFGEGWWKFICQRQQREILFYQLQPHILL